MSEALGGSIWDTPGSKAVKQDGRQPEEASSSGEGPLEERLLP